MGEAVENTIREPKIINTIMGGINHHFLFFSKYSNNSLNIPLLTLGHIIANDTSNKTIILLQ